jgi:hypothetical protein
VATDTISGLENVNAVASFGQLIGASQPGDARSYDCNVHRW